MENSGAIIPFNDENDNTQVLFVTPYEECIEFFVPSKFRYDSMQEVPKMLAVKLLHKNSTLKIGTSLMVNNALFIVSFVTITNRCLDIEGTRIWR